MSFWGIELKPDKPFTLEPDNGGKLFLTQATLGNGLSSKKSTLQVTVGDAEPVFICSLLPDKSESVSLNLEFDEKDGVTFSVVGPTSIHVSGIFQRDEDIEDEDDYDSDIYADGSPVSGSEDSEFDSEDDSEDDFISEDDMPMFSPSSARNSGVVIEEIVDDEKPTNDNVGNKKTKKKKGSANADNDKKCQQQIVVKEPTAAPILESEDEDGFPVSRSGKPGPVDSQENTATKTTNEAKKQNNIKKDAKDEGQSANKLKRKVDAVDQDEEPDRNASDGKKKQKKKKKKAAKTDNDGAVEPNVKENASEVSNLKQDASKEDKKMSKAADKVTKERKDKAAKIRTFANGMTIEELQMGKPNGKRASNGKKVSVHYIGKLQKTGKIFDSNIGNQKPFKFRLGVGQVIKGWDTGVEGMRVGDKRRLTIPPSFGYGTKGAGPDIPPNAWLVFDVELVDVA